MQTITATNLKQNSMLLQNALRGDLLITKREKPFVVVMDYEKYKKLESYINKIANKKTLDAISNLEDNEDILSFKSKEDLYENLGI